MQVRRLRLPEQTLLYQVVARDWPGVCERAELEGGLPKFIVDELEVQRRRAAFKVIDGGG
ncbi:MAG: hypothetical protein R6X02_25105 [Enhygromyxa sp.]